MAIADMKSSDFLKKIKENPKFQHVPIVSYTRLLTYKLTSPDMLPKSVPESEEAAQTLEILKENLNLVPGEIILWVEEAMISQHLEIPPLLRSAVNILKKILS